MTKINTKRWKVILPTSIAAILLVGVAGLNLFDSNAQAEVHFLAECDLTVVNCQVNTGQCGIDHFTGVPLQILHFDKIIFKNGNDLLNGIGGLVEEGSIMDIKVLDDPNRIEFPMEKAVQKLNNAGWTTDEGEPITLKDLELIDVEYAIVCAFGET